MWIFWLANAFAGGLHITALNRMIFLLAPRNSAATFLAVNSMIGHLSMMVGEATGVDIAARYGIRASFIAGAVLTSLMILPAALLTSDANDPVTKRLAADAAKLRAMLKLGGAVAVDAPPPGPSAAGLFPEEAQDSEINPLKTAARRSEGGSGGSGDMGIEALDPPQLPSRAERAALANAVHSERVAPARAAFEPRPVLDVAGGAARPAAVGGPGGGRGEASSPEDGAPSSITASME